MSIKILRFGPMEGYGSWNDTVFTAGALGEDGFPVGTYEDIPEGTRLRIETLPRRECIFDEKVEGSYSRNFDPGKYAYMMKVDFPLTEDDPKPRCFMKSGVFLVDMTEKQWATLRNMKPRNAHARQTSEGPLWTCNYASCGKKSHTRMAAFLHESNVHFGIDPIKNPEKARRIEAGLIKPTDDPKEQHQASTASAPLAPRMAERAAPRKAKPAKGGRPPLSEERKQRLRENLAKARAAKKAEQAPQPEA